eukprot:COSAG03_NODE_316_length_9052_cov_3.462080_4_plen_95_part_00
MITLFTCLCLCFHRRLLARVDTVEASLTHLAQRSKLGLISDSDVFAHSTRFDNMCRIMQEVFVHAIPGGEFLGTPRADLLASPTPRGLAQIHNP